MGAHNGTLRIRRPPPVVEILLKNDSFQLRDRGGSKEDAHNRILIISLRSKKFRQMLAGVTTTGDSPDTKDNICGIFYFKSRL